MKIGKQHFAAAANLVMSLRPGDAPPATARLVELVAEPQQRIEQLERQRGAPKRGLFARRASQESS